MKFLLFQDNFAMCLETFFQDMMPAQKQVCTLNFVRSYHREENGSKYSASPEDGCLPGCSV